MLDRKARLHVGDERRPSSDGVIGLLVRRGAIVAGRAAAQAERAAQPRNPAREFSCNSCLPCLQKSQCQKAVFDCHRIVSDQRCSKAGQAKRLSGEHLVNDLTGHADIRHAIMSTPHYFAFATFSHRSVFADLSTASQTYWVSSASRKVGWVGFRLARPSRKSANWWTKLCS
jgi:hypothetical protein